MPDALCVKIKFTIDLTNIWFNNTLVFLYSDIGYKQSIMLSHSITPVLILTLHTGLCFADKCHFNITRFQCPGITSLIIDSHSSTVTICWFRLSRCPVTHNSWTNGAICPWSCLQVRRSIHSYSIVTYKQLSYLCNINTN